MAEPAYRIESVDKALRLLHLFRVKQSWTVSEASRVLGVAPSTAHRLLVMLQWHGFAQQNPGSKAYEAGRALLPLDLATVRELAVRDVAGPEIQRLSDRVRETVHLVVLEGARTLIVDEVEGPHAVGSSASIGDSAPPNCGASGKMLLSALAPPDVALLVGPDPLEQNTQYSISTLAELEIELARVRRQGYATNFDEHTLGSTGISVAIPVPAGLTPAAITVNAPSSRLTRRRIPSVVTALRRAAKQIAAKLEPAVPAEPFSG